MQPGKKELKQKTGSAEAPKNEYSFDLSNIPGHFLTFEFKQSYSAMMVLWILNEVTCDPLVIYDLFNLLAVH